MTRAATSHRAPAIPELREADIVAHSYPAGRRRGQSVPNRVRRADGLVFIELSKGREAIIDDADYLTVREHRWIFSCGYAKTNGFHGSRFAKGTYLHRAIYGLEGPMVDHENANGLDCRRLNLRPATKAQNNANQRKTRGTSRFKGVCWDGTKRRWKAAIKVEGRTVHIGRFRDETDAATAYNFVAYEHFGAYARMNAV